MMKLFHSLIDVKLITALFDLDCAIAEHVRLKRCPYCGGPLHYARFPRKPRGLPFKPSRTELFRQGLCCGNKECRRRTLPSSCLFMGRKWVFRCVILVFLTLWHNRLRPVFELSEILGVDVGTLRRWRAYFRDMFPTQPAWKRLRGHVQAKLGNRQLPGALVMLFFQGIRDGPEMRRALIRCIQFFVSGEAPMVTEIRGWKKYAENAS